MPDERLVRVRRLFVAAVDLPAPQRAEFLDGECAAAAEIRAEVEALLDAHQIENSPVDLTFSDLITLLSREPEPAPFPFRTCGDYRLVDRIGGGGMGEVFLAERIDNGNRVAIKVLKQGPGSNPSVVRRFESEKQLLGQLQHPNIVRFYHSGVESDRPWFAMDYINGVPIDVYCKAHSLSLRARLELMDKVCDAVSYAHGKTIVHCDLTPNNILVTEDGEPHLVDFGIAKAQNAAPEALRLTSGTRPYSVEYASPEQIENKPLDTKTDSWSLGVILYALLAGQPPFTAEGILSARVIEDKILRDEPVRPSKPAGLSGVPASFGSSLKWKELDGLCLWALRKEPEKRCRVDQLGDDIGRFLRSEPLQSHAAGWGYIAGKFTCRYKAWVATATLVFITIGGLIAFATHRIARERDSALAEAARTRRIQRFMLDLFGNADKDAAPSNELRVVSLLDRGAREADALSPDPETQAELYETLGRMYGFLGKSQRADNLLKSAIEKMRAANPESPKLADFLVERGTMKEEQAQFKDAESMIREGLSLANRHLPPNDPTVFGAQAALGVLWARSGAYDQAIAVLNPLVKVKAGGEEGQHILSDILPALASAEADTAHLDVAESLESRALALDRQMLGNSHPRVGFVLGELASFKATRGQFPEAVALYRESMEIYKSWYGENHPATATAASILALVLTQDGKYDEALPLLLQALPIQEQAYGENHPYVAVILDALGTQELHRGNTVAAEQYAERAVRIDRALYGDENHTTATVKGHLAQVFIKREEYDRAEPILVEVVAALTKKSLPGNMAVGGAQALLGHVLLKRKQYAEAEEHLTAAHTIFGDRRLAMAQRVREDLVQLYIDVHRPEKAAQFRAEVAVAASPQQ